MTAIRAPRFKIEELTAALILLFSNIHMVSAADETHDYLVTLSSVRARPLAMGGAYISRRDFFSSLDFNPAGFDLKTETDGFQVSCFLNPLAPYLIYENKETINHWATPVAWVLRGLGVKTGKYSFGLLFGEEMFSNSERLERPNFFDGSDYEWHYNSTVGLSMALAPRVSLGLAADFYSRALEDSKHIDVGYRYGLILQPRPSVSVGLSYCDFPNDYRQERMRLERLADETLNIGISFTPWRFLTLSLDVRNVSDEERGAEREPHIGMEWMPFSHVMLRGGFYRISDDKTNVYSCGIGLFNGNVIQPQERRFQRIMPVLNIAMIWESEPACMNRWFILSMMLRVW